MAHEIRAGVAGDAEALGRLVVAIGGFAAQAKATIKRTNMLPAPVARYPDALLMGKAKDAAFIMDGGFR